MRHGEEVSSVAISPDGLTLMTGSLDGTARYWDSATGEQLGPPIRHAGGVRAVAFRPDGRRAATGCKDKIARQWPVPTAPLQGEPGDLRRWVEMICRMRLDKGAFPRLSAEEVEERRSLLSAGFPPLP
jgi:WD40 repeat protein